MPISVKNVLEEVLQISSLIQLVLLSACLSNILCKEIGSVHKFFQCTQKCYFFWGGVEGGNRLITSKAKMDGICF